MRRHELTDQQWELIAPFFPANGQRGGQWSDHRTALNGILWRLNTGAPWRDLPPRYGPWQTVHGRLTALRQSGLLDRITAWTWVAVGLVLVESIVLVAFGWTCPLTILAERLGDGRGSVADIFLPRWIADRIFPICGTTYAIALVLLLIRVLR